MDVLLPATVLYLVDIYTCTHTVKTCYIRYLWWKVAPPKSQADFRIAHLNALRKPGRQVSRYLARRGLGGRSPPHGRYSAVPQTNYRLGKGPPLRPHTHPILAPGPETALCELQRKGDWTLVNWITDSDSVYRSRPG